MDVICEGWKKKNRIVAEQGSIRFQKDDGLFRKRIAHLLCMSCVISADTDKLHTSTNYEWVTNLRMRFYQEREVRFHFLLLNSLRRKRVITVLVLDGKSPFIIQS